MLSKDCEDLLVALGQQALLSNAALLDSAAQATLCRALAQLDGALLQKQRGALAAGGGAAVALPPPQGAPLRDDAEGLREARHLVRQGRLACLIVAGGSGSRLGYPKPKGTYPISVVKGKSLFALFCEKIAAAQRRCDGSIPLAIMTSHRNEGETTAFFHEHSFFGLDAAAVELFTQGDLPYLDGRGCLVVDGRGKVALGPDGNGMALRNLCVSGVAERWWDAGVRYVHFLLVDNALGNPADLPLLAHHRRSGGGLTFKAVTRDVDERQLGVFVSREGRLSIAEYSEIDPLLMAAVDDAGMPLYPYGNISNFIVDLEAIGAMHRSGWWEGMPLHICEKQIPTDEGVFALAKAYKSEYFIFDIMPFFRDIHLAVVPRAQHFAPLKDTSSLYGAAAVREALLAADRAQWQRVSGKAPSRGRLFELDAAFYFPSDAMVERWRGRPLPPDAFIEP